MTLGTRLNDALFLKIIFIYRNRSIIIQQRKKYITAWIFSLLHSVYNILTSNYDSGNAFFSKVFLFCVAWLGHTQKHLEKTNSYILSLLLPSIAWLFDHLPTFVNWKLRCKRISMFYAVVKRLYFISFVINRTYGLKSISNCWVRTRKLRNHKSVYVRKWHTFVYRHNWHIK